MFLQRNPIKGTAGRASSIGDSLHTLEVEEFYFEDGKVNFSLQLHHPKTCEVWWGCKESCHLESRVVTPGKVFSIVETVGKPKYHTHMRYDCALGYEEENIGIKDALGLGYDLKYFSIKHDDWLDDIYWRLMAHSLSGQHIPITWNWSGGYDSFSGEYDSIIEWEFNYSGISR